MAPAHMLAAPDSESTMCELRRTDRAPRYPIVLHAHAVAHVRGYGMRVCAGCVDSLGMLADPELAAAAR